MLLETPEQGKRREGQTNRRYFHDDQIQTMELSGFSEI